MKPRVDVHGLLKHKILKQNMATAYAIAVYLVTDLTVWVIKHLPNRRLHFQSLAIRADFLTCRRWISLLHRWRY